MLSICTNKVLLSPCGLPVWMSPCWCGPVNGLIRAGCVSGKPPPYGNEYHSMCFGLSGIMYSIELVEGKDWTHQCPQNFLKKRGGQLHYFTTL
jgi:hypothetical protein